MALQYSNTTDSVDLGSAASVDNMRIGAILMWVWVDTYTSTRRLFAKHTTLNVRRDFRFLDVTGTATLGFTLGRGTTNLSIEASVANFAAYATGKWLCVAAIFDADGVNGGQRLLMGDLTTTLAEPSGYTTQIVGTGTTGSDATANAVIGNTAVGGSFSFPGKIGIVQIIRDRTVSVAEAISLQFRPRKVSGTNGLYWLGFNGTGTQPDWSGSGNNGSVAGATVAASVPIGAPFGRPGTKLMAATLATLAATGSVASSGALARQDNKALSGSETPVGALVKHAGKVYAGSETAIGALAKLANKALTGSETPTGSLVRSALKGLSGVAAPAGAIVRACAQGLAGSIAAVGGLAKSVSKALSGSTTPVGALALIKVVLMNITAGLGLSGALARLTDKGLSGSSSTAGSLVRDVSFLQSGTLDLAGSLGKLIAKFWSGVLDLVGSLVTSGVGASTPSIVDVVGEYRTTLDATGTAFSILNFVGESRTTLDYTGKRE
jgi:hypothetical protein